jgi:Domain of unknown function (DUF5610)
MESLEALNADVVRQPSPAPFSSYAASAQFSNSDALVISTLSDDAGANDVDFRPSFKALSLTAQEILSKLNEMLQGRLPDGIESLDPAEVTPDATAERIVSGIVAMYDGYVKSNPDLLPEEALTRFMAAARKGVDEGYSDAYEILDGLGAFQFDGVESGISQTKGFIEEKLAAFEQIKRDEITGAATVTSTSSSSVRDEVLASSGSVVRSVNTVA